MALASIVQDQFGGGIFRGRRAPADSVYDAVNALLNDERQLFRRGGSAYKSGASTGATILGLWDGIVSAGQRTFFWSGSSPYVLDSNDSTVLNLGSANPSPLVRGVEVAGIVFFQAGLSSGEQSEVVYAGSRKAAYSTGVVSYTAGSATVTGGGGSLWLANVDPGMILRIPIGAKWIVIGYVKSVESNTSLTLTKPSSAGAGATTYSLVPVHQQTAIGTSVGTVGGYLNPQSMVHATAGRRLLRILDNRIYLSRRSGDGWFYNAPGTVQYFTGTFESDSAPDYHELPRAALIIGADAIEDTAVLFTTNGVWVIENLALDLLDDVGNIQHRVAQINQDIVLWGDPGIASYEGALIVPAIDDVYAFSLSAPPVPVSQGIRPLYREYVEAGYKPGTATVYRGTYWLPIVDGSNNVVDALVCRLDLTDPTGARRPAWTRQANGAAGRAYATRIGATTRTPKLLGLDGLRVSDLTGCFDPDATRKDDADGTDHQLTVDSNDFQTGPGGRANTVRSALVTAELVDAASDNPTYQFFTAAGPEGSTYTQAPDMSTGSGNMPETDGTIPTQILVVGPNGAGGRKVDRIRWRFRTSGAAASAILRRVELKIRLAGRR